MKYIVTEDEEGNEEIFLFPNSVMHICMAEVLCRIKDTPLSPWKRVRREPVSAGFVQFDVGLKCYGESESMKLKSRPDEDTKLLLNTFAYG